MPEWCRECPENSNKMKTQKKSSAKPKTEETPEPKKRNRIQVQFDIEYGGHAGTNPKGKSETVPDLNLTVRQLLQNHTRGTGSEVKVSEPVYFDQEIPTILDITDVEAYKEQLEQRLEQVNEFVIADKEKADQDRLNEAAIKKQSEQDQKDLKRGKQLRIDEESEKI